MEKDLLELTNILSRVSKMIEEKYLEIIDAEIKEKDTESLIEELRSLVELENTFYDEIPEDTQTLLVLKNILDESTKEMTESVLYSNMGIIKLTKYRALREIERKLLEDENFILYQFAPDEVRESLESDEAEIVSYSFNAPVFEMQELYNTLEQDIKEMWLTLIDNKIHLEENPKLKERLINAKYGIFFLNKELEKNYINDDFETYDEPCISYGLIKEQYNLPKDKIQNGIDAHLTNLIVIEIGLLLNYSDKDYEDINVLLKSQLSETYIRSLLQLGSKDLYEKVQEEFFKLLDDKELEDFLIDKTDSINTILSTFEYYNRDKKNTKTLTFKL